MYRRHKVRNQGPIIYRVVTTVKLTMRRRHEDKAMEIGDAHNDF